MTAGRRLVAVALAIPTLAAAIVLTAIEAWRAYEPRAPLFAAPFVFSLADAIERGELLQAHQFLRAKKDPHAPIVVRHAVLTGGQTVAVSPLLWAVATQNREAVQMLLGVGARMDRGPDRKAACLARALGNDGLAEYLQAYGAPSDESCPAPGADRSPLVALVSTSD